MRDDVFKVLLAGAFLMNGPRWMTYCTALEGSPHQMLNFKASEFLFRVPGQIDPVSLLPKASSNAKSRIRSHLAQALAIARSVTRLDEAPQYQLIIDALAAARQIAESPAVLI
jgi:hypothetical protein